MSRLIKPTRRALLGGLGLVIASPAIVRAGSMMLLGAGKPQGGGAPFSALINFRGTVGGATDGIGQTYCLGDTYPTTRAGLTFGWESGGAITPADRSGPTDPRLSGINYQFGGAPSVFRLDLPSAGVYSCDMASGDTFAQTNQIQTFVDSAATLQTIASHATAASHWVDINGTDFNGDAAWVAGHVPLALTFATTIFRFTTSGTAGTISHLSVVR